MFYGDGNAAGHGCGEDGIELKDTYPFVACEAGHGDPIVSCRPCRATVGKRPALPHELRGGETFLGVLLKYTPMKGVVLCLGTNDVLVPRTLARTGSAPMSPTWWTMCVCSTARSPCCW